MYLHKCERIVSKTQPLQENVLKWNEMKNSVNYFHGNHPAVLLKNHCEFVFTAKNIAECKKLMSLMVNTNYQWLIKQIMGQEKKNCKCGIIMVILIVVWMGNERVGNYTYVYN